MLKLAALLVSFFLVSSTVGHTSPSPYYGEESYNPCGVDGIQRDSLTAYFEHTFVADYKDLSEEETLYFLKQIGQENSRISNVRIFRSLRQPDYAIVSSYLFQSFLEGKVLVELYCVERLNGSPALYITKEGIENFIGKSFSEIGLGEKEE